MPELLLDINLPLIKIIVNDIEKIRLLYNRIQVFRSSDNTTYTEITADDYMPAIINGSVSGPFNLTGTTLVIQKENLNYTFNFTKAYDTLSLISLINNTVGFTFASNTASNNKLTLESNIKGSGSWIQVSGTAASILGFSTVKVYGKGRRIDLTYPTTIYKFFDLSDVSLPSWYKIRLYSDLTNRVSDFSLPIQAVPPPILDPSLFVTGSLQLSDTNGNPIANNRIIITPIVYKTFIGVGVLNYQKQIIGNTDQFGNFSIKLLKGIQVRVDIDGADIGREIAVPTTDFNILTQISLSPDPMNIKEAPIYPIILS